MCGIVGYIGTQPATEILLEGLRKLEYRGYDSAGIATVWDEKLHCVRAKGKLYNLQASLNGHATPAQIGIGHTRWATHGKPEEHNAHPHIDMARRVAVVQNGIIENHRELREMLQAKGYEFVTETDTETIPHLIADYLQKITKDPQQPFSPFLEAVRLTISDLEGAFAIAVLCADYPDELIIARQQAPLCIGFGQGEFFCASDTTAIANHTQTVLSLENGELAKLSPLGVEVYNFQGQRLRKQPRTLDWNPSLVEKQGFRHFMLKEIYEQPGVVRACLEAYFGNSEFGIRNSETEISSEFGVRSSELVTNSETEISSEFGVRSSELVTNSELRSRSISAGKTPNSVRAASPQEKLQTPNSFQIPNSELRSRSVSAGETLNSFRIPNSVRVASPKEKLRTPNSELLPPDLYNDLQQVQILACGTSWHASLVGKYLIEQLAGIPTIVQYASEFRYAPAPLIPNTLTIGVTQSGETADTLAALEMEHERRNRKGGAYRSRLLGITNRRESTLAHLVPHLIVTPAGIEVGVAATKTFVAQVMAFYALAIDLASYHQSLPAKRLQNLIEALHQLPTQMEQILENQGATIEALAHQFIETRDFIFVGRGINFPIALEGALKLKEISYIHAEGYPAGEMKHGPIALLDSKVPVVAIAVPGTVYDKVLSNAQEAKARDARLIGVTPEGKESDVFDDLLPIPPVDELVSPILTVVPLQLLAYHIAALRGLDVDQPRNLAKSVTVE